MKSIGSFTIDVIYKLMEINLNIKPFNENNRIFNYFCIYHLVLSCAQPLVQLEYECLIWMVYMRPYFNLHLYYVFYNIVLLITIILIYIYIYI